MRKARDGYVAPGRVALAWRAVTTTETESELLTQAKKQTEALETIRGGVIALVWLVGFLVAAGLIGAFVAYIQTL